jgi:hypothetical protein
MLFLELDHGSILRKETGLDTPRIVRLLIGNPLIMKEMAKQVPDAGSYAPVTILLDERPDGVHLTYDRMSSLLAPYGNAEALAVARDLDCSASRSSGCCRHWMEVRGLPEGRRRSESQPGNDDWADGRVGRGKPRQLLPLRWGQSTATWTCGMPSSRSR